MAGLLGSFLGQQMGQRMGLLDPEEPRREKPPGFWDGGDKFTTRDAIAALLAGIGDVAARQNGYDGGASQMLAGGRLDAMELAKKRQAQQAQLQQAAQLIKASYPDMPDAQVLAIASGVLNPSDVKPETNPMERDTKTWMGWGDDQRGAYTEMQQAKNPFMIGRDGLPYARPALPSRPVGKLTPLDEGGPTASRSGGFPRSY